MHNYCKETADGHYGKPEIRWAPDSQSLSFHGDRIRMEDIRTIIHKHATDAERILLTKLIYN